MEREYKGDLKKLLQAGRRFLVEMEEKGHTDADCSGSCIETHEAGKFRGALDKAAKALKVVAVLLLVTAPARAWFVTGNPDPFPSVGFNVENTSVGGTRYEIDQPGTTLDRVQSGPEKHTRRSAGVDVRLPVTANVTLTLYGDQVNESVAYDRNHGAFTSGQTFYREKADLDGWRYGLSMRLYLNK